MTEYYDRETFFDAVRRAPFPGVLGQKQVDGMGFILEAWETFYQGGDVRWLAYALATTFHETAQEMWPIEEYKGAEQSYGAVDPETGQRYFGRGFVQVTHRENYAKTDERFDLTGVLSTELDAANMLRPLIAAGAMFKGMEEGWFRSDEGGRQTFGRYFYANYSDPYGAREIINGDKTLVPNWSNGMPIGELIANYYNDFLSALKSAHRNSSGPEGPSRSRLDVKPDKIEVVLTYPKGVVVTLKEVD